MKAKKDSQSGAVTVPLLESIVKRDQDNFKAHFPDASIGSKPLAQPALYQDPGGAYRQNLTYPQK